MKQNRRKLVRRSFMAVVTGTSAFALQACGDNESGAGGNNSASQKEQPAGSDSDSH
jgi:hypothetical protein